MKDKQVFAQIAVRFGAANLVAGGLLMLGWFVLPTLSIQIPMLGTFTFTFWQVLGLLNSDNLLEMMGRGGRLGAGFYGFLALIALAAPFLRLIWKDKRAALGGLAPLVFILIVWVLARHGIQSAFAGGIASADNDFARQAQEAAMSGVSLGFGAYVSALASIYFAAVAVKRFLKLGASARVIPARANRAVA
jgi:hypothetical protein